TRFKEAAQTSGYQLALYDSSGQLTEAYRDSDTTFVPPQNLTAGILESIIAREGLPLLPRNPDSDLLTSYIELQDASGHIRYLHVGQLK
ncbi:hypothetical protein SB781_35595, partial [Paraburkholderia sp. SIMBA_061]